MVLRIEDLDTRCHNPLWSDLFIEDLRWLGLDWDEGPFYQRDRTNLYEDALKKLVASGLTYPCFCTRAELHAASAPHASDGTPIYAARAAASRLQRWRSAQPYGCRQRACVCRKQQSFRYY